MKYIQRIIYSVRDLIWEYPDILFFEKNSSFNSLYLGYKKFRPFSHFLSTLIIYLLIILTFFVNVSALIQFKNNEFIEGVVVGIDENGELLGLTRINPLILSNIQLEKDISNLIYESLVSVDQNGEIRSQLVESYGEIRPANHYRFKLREDVYWHDGEKLTTKDVEETFKLLKRLNQNSETASNFSNVVDSQFDNLKIIDDYTFELKLKSSDGVLPTFFESISFKILPAKYIEKLNADTILRKNIEINISPVGTGPYRANFDANDKDDIELVRNETYYMGKPNISILKFKLFKTEEEAFEALQSFKIHAISGLSAEMHNKVSTLSNYTIYKSNVIYNQYWALYFNLSDNNSDSELQNKKLRQAVSYAIDKERIVEALFNLGIVAHGTIPENSFAYADINYITYDLEKANQILEDEGWTKDQITGVREKDGKKLEFDMVFLDNVDRQQTATIIQDNLKDVGIKINLVPESIVELNNKYVLPKNFEILLYGETTFKDPDRYELFHSDHIKFPDQGGSESSTGLNLSSFISEAQDSKIINQEVVRIPKADMLLEDARSYINKDKRKEAYIEFQKILVDETPVIFLYHPTFSYIVSNRIQGIRMDEMSNREDRFTNVYEWK